MTIAKLPLAKELAETQSLRAKEQKRAAGRLKVVLGGITAVAILAVAAFLMAVEVTAGSMIS